MLGPGNVDLQISKMGRRRDKGSPFLFLGVRHHQESPSTRVGRLVGRKGDDDAHRPYLQHNRGGFVRARLDVSRRSAITGICNNAKLVRGHLFQSRYLTRGGGGEGRRRDEPLPVPEREGSAYLQTNGRARRVIRETSKRTAFMDGKATKKTSFLAELVRNEARCCAAGCLRTDLYAFEGERVVLRKPGFGRKLGTIKVRLGSEFGLKGFANKPRRLGFQWGGMDGRDSDAGGDVPRREKRLLCQSGDRDFIRRI